MTSLETTITRMTGIPLVPPPANYPEPASLPVYRVCPLCKRVPAFIVQRQQWECYEHGPVQPMKSAVVNPYE